MNAIAFSVLTCIARGFIRSSILSEQIKRLLSSFTVIFVYFFSSLLSSEFFCYSFLCFSASKIYVGICRTLFLAFLSLIVDNNNLSIRSGVYQANSYYCAYLPLGVLV